MDSPHRSGLVAGQRGRQADPEAVLPSRLLPRISFRSLLGLTTASAIVIAVVSAAGDGGAYAIAGAVGLGYLLGCFVLFVALFLLSWAVAMFPRLVGVALMVAGVQLLVARLTGTSFAGLAFLTSTVSLVGIEVIGLFLLLYPIGRETQDAAHSPFAEDQLPPQIFAPRDPTDS
ncbi:hypothetical protein [Roseiconus lacunae]|uniref:DUF4345 domain-containing protein n=1 Tax=Roseiconus lacunae TaxID=2605694 RepID=A0ABT7PBR7_9BACT|nr:hypothetical protein [Roseiconus lacunae]MCD0462103.1 hypothetical protein [Roseiconus lacunae]MDM4013940.1 hypothetical protein [Roseiconus lacunae]WRQ53236.1 hypothetical protein U8335_12080 [Stieleria sp. HD01]